MNIFAVSTAPYVCAQVLDDRRLVKMVLETAQILSMAATSGTLPIMQPELIYKSTHLNHPVVRWACNSQPRALWTRQLLLCLSDEYTHRFGKTHQSCVVFDAVWDGDGMLWPVPTEADFPNCSNVSGYSTFECYRRRLTQKWIADTDAGRTPTWRRRGPPEWLERYLWSDAREPILTLADEAA